MINILLDGQQIGAIDPDALTLGDQIDLEEARGVKDICAWLVAHAGADLPVLRKLPFAKLNELAEGVAAALKEAAEVPLTKRSA